MLPIYYNLRGWDENGTERGTVAGVGVGVIFGIW